MSSLPSPYDLPPGGGPLPTDSPERQEQIKQYYTAVNKEAIPVLENFIDSLNVEGIQLTTHDLPIIDKQLHPMGSPRHGTITIPLLVPGTITIPQIVSEFREDPITVPLSEIRHYEDLLGKVILPYIPHCAAFVRKKSLGAAELEPKARNICAEYTAHFTPPVPFPTDSKSQHLLSQNCFSYVRISANSAFEPAPLKPDMDDLKEKYEWGKLVAVVVLGNFDRHKGGQLSLVLARDVKDGVWDAMDMGWDLRTMNPWDCFVEWRGTKIGSLPFGADPGLRYQLEFFMQNTG